MAEKAIGLAIALDDPRPLNEAAVSVQLLELGHAALDLRRDLGLDHTAA